MTTDLAEVSDAPGAAATAIGKSSLLPDPRFLLDIFRRRLLLFIAIFCVVAGAAVAYAMLAQRLYEATAVIEIEPRQGDPVQANRAATIEQAPSSDFIDTQILVLDSLPLAEQVAVSLRLADDPAFGGNSTSPPPGSDAARARLRAIAQTLRGMTAIRRSGQTTLIEIVATTGSPMLSARIANAFAAQYLALIASQRATGDERSSTLIDQRMAELQRDAEQADAALQRYKIANGLMSAEGATMAEQETSTLNQQIAQARAELAQRQGRLSAARRQLQSGGGGSDVTSALASGTIGALRQQEADSSRNLAQLRTRYGPKHPAVGQEEQRLADTQRQIQLEIDRILSSLEGEVNVAASGLSSLLASQSGARGRLAANASAQVGFLELQRKAEAARTIYEAFLNSSRGAEAREGIQPPLASLSTSATPPGSPSSPNVLLIILLGGLFGLLAGFAAVAIAEYLDSRIRDRQDVERRLGARYLGAVPELGSTLDGLRNNEAPQDYILSHPLSSFAEALRSLRSTVTLRGARRPKVLAIASALPQEGKTTTALCLARTLAMAGTKTVLVDCDLRRHGASDFLLKGRPGRLAEVLAGTLGVDEALLCDDATELQILGVSEAPTDGRDLLTPELFDPLLDLLRERFEFVVIDTAPILGVADARSVARCADTVVLLARWRETSLRTTDAALDMLVDARADIAGVALSLVDVRRFGTASAEDLYGYHRKFKGYYSN